LGENDKIGHISTFGNFSIFALSSIYLKISGFQAVIRITIPDMDEWLKNVENILVDSYGLARDFAGDASRLLAYLFQYGLNPRITRGWSSPEHQKELQARWDRGDRAGLRVRPASSSEHTAESWGQPAARAIDIVTDNDVTAAQIARALKIGTGMDFKTPDAGHFFAKA
jgi:hypothetical protein